MKVVVFGASGRTGQLVVRQALEKGHRVTAFARALPADPIAHPKLRVVTGDALDRAAVGAAVEGQDAVVSTIGPSGGGSQTICTESIVNIIKAMKDHGVARLVVLTSATDMEGGFLYDRIVRPLFLRKVYEDKERQEMEVFKSGLDWTIVRPPIMRDGPRTGAYRVAIGTPPKGGWRVSRADVAEFMVRELARKDYVHQAIAIAY
jgi:putative NADH-flavin reductase